MRHMTILMRHMTFLMRHSMKTAIVSFLVLVGLASGPVFAVESVGNAVAVIGSASVVRALDGAQEVLASNSELFLDDRVLTGADGLVKLLLRDESILKISPNSEVSISAMIAGPGADGTSTVDLLKGKLRSVIGNKLGANTEFNINTPVAVAGVRGTDFEVVHVLRGGEWVTGVRCYNGAVALVVPGVSDSTGLIILPRQYSVASSGKVPSQPKTIKATDSLTDIIGGDETAEGSTDSPTDETTEETTEETTKETSEVTTNDSTETDSSDQAKELELDAQQIQSVLGDLGVGIDVGLQQVVDTLIIIDANEPKVVVETVIEQEDTQLELIKESLTNASTLKFEVDIPLPGSGSAQ